MGPENTFASTSSTRLWRNVGPWVTVALVSLLLLASMPAIAGAAEATVDITTTLEPRDLTVAVGTTVTWSNNDGDRHRIRTTSGPTDIDSGNIDSGGSFSFTFQVEGTYLYVDDRNRDNANYYGSVIVTADEPPPGGEPPPPPPPTGDVRIVDDTFLPGSITVTVGGTVTWANQDRDHTVTARDRSWDSGIFDAGQTYTRTFNSGGTYEYFCVIHPDMIGTVVVTDGSGEPPPPPPPPPPTTTIPPPPSGSGDVSIIDNDFTPSNLSVAVGASVEWVNTGQLPHTVTAAGQFDSGFLMTGDTYTRTFNAAGTYNYICTLHPEMTATITVTGSSGEPPPPPPPGEEPPPPEDPSPPPPPPPPGAISIIDNDYTPRSRTITVGSTVQWVNSGQLPHTVTAAGQFDSGFLMTGDTYARTFNAAGTYNYTCTIHPEMVGTITVTGADGGGGDGEPPPAPDEDPAVAADSSQAVTTVASAGATAEVNLIDNAYDPADLTVVAGQEVLFVNVGLLPHTVTARDESFDSGFLMEGDSWTTTFDTPGVIEYFCVIHPEMIGTITVTEAGPGTATAGDEEILAAGPGEIGSEQPVAGSITRATTDPMAGTLVIVFLVALVAGLFILLAERTEIEETS